MLGAAGWPLSELWHREIADNLDRACCYCVHVDY